MRFVLQILIAVAALVPQGTQAVSSGLTSFCKADQNIGCDKWALKNGQEDRLECTDPTAGEMPWVKKPVGSDNYSVRAGDEVASADATEYTPGEITNIYIRYLKYDWKYRGLIIHAVDDSGKTVGEWETPPDTNDEVVQTPKTCGKGVLLHADALVKPARLRLQWRAPVAGTGKVTFICLIKRGPANAGFFYYPNNNNPLTLKERATKSKPQLWFLAEEGESCNRACTKQRPGSTCKDSTLTAMNTPPSFFAGVGNFHACNLPLLSTCTASGPSRTINQSLCSFHDTTCTKDRQPQTTGCASNSAPGIQRFCPCDTDGGAIDGTVRTDEIDDDGIDSLSAAVAVFGALRGLPTFAVMITTLLLTAQPSFAHNWMVGPARSKNSATSSCGQFNGYHAQVGDEDEAFVKWASGHESWSYLVCVPGDEEHRLKDRAIQTIVDDYLDAAVGDQILPMSGSNKKYHGTTSTNENSYQNDGFILRKVDPSSAQYKAFDAPNSPAQTLWEYKDDSAAVKNDKRANYASSKYPWIVQAGKFFHHKPRSSDWDGVTVKMRKGVPAGRVTCNWIWQGYRDCVDIEYKPGEKIDSVFGNGAEGFTWNRIDHCQYVNPKKILTPCMPSPAGVDLVVGLMPDGGRGDKTKSYGINVVPAQNPSSVFKDWRSASVIPWTDPVCKGQRSTDQVNSLTGPIAYAVEARDTDELTPEYITSNDPEDPVFYSTCYVRQKSNPFGSVVKEIGPLEWRFSGQCLACDSVEENQPFRDHMVSPVWEVAKNTCIDCIKEPPSFMVPKWQAKEKTKCASKTCDGTNCIKNLRVQGRTPTTPHECKFLVDADSGCQGAAIHDTNTGECQCYRTKDCCGQCSEELRGASTLFTSNGKTRPVVPATFEQVQPVPLPVGPECAGEQDECKCNGIVSYGATPAGVGSPTGFFFKGSFWVHSVQQWRLR